MTRQSSSAGESRTSPKEAQVATVYLNGKRRQLAPTAVIGSGGEADVYDLGNSQVLKLYKRADDPVYTGNPTAQQGAMARLQECQHKLPAFPKGLPAHVIAPVDLVYDKASAGAVVGYTMPYLKNMEVLLQFGDRKYREQGGIDGNQVADIFRELHGMVTQVHKGGVVIGDFNDLNVLVDGQGQVYLVDADSMQYGKFFCRTFTSRFVDPLRCDQSQLTLTQPHNFDSDWYAFNVMLFQSMLYAGPYGGVHKPANGKRLQHDARVLDRLTVFSQDVIYPKPALPYDRLPDDLLEHFRRVYEKDERGEFPLKLLQTIRWTTCTNCGSVHARARCPQCAAPGAVKQTVIIRGTVTATREFQTTGQILQATVIDGKLRYLYHENGVFYREGGKRLLDGGLDPELRFRITRDQTLIGKRERLIILQDGQVSQQTTGTVGLLPIFDASERDYFWIEGNQLRRSAKLGSDFIGTVLPGRTLLWTGKKFGFGFFQAGGLQRAFVFDVGGHGLNDQVNLPLLPGQMVDATSVSSDNLVWFLATVQDNGRLVNHCFVINGQTGALVTHVSADHDEESWLNSGIRGHFATGNSLFVATDEGVVRVEADIKFNVLEVAQTFPDTEPFVDSTSQLLPGPGGIYVISTHDVTVLRIQ